MNGAKQTTGNRLVILSIIGLPVTMILAGTWLWFFVMRGDIDLIGTLGTANSGELVIPPRQIDEVSMRDSGGAVMAYEDFPERKWTLLVVNSGPACDQDCEHNLYMTRQIHIAVGKEVHRIRRVYSSETPAGETQLMVEQLSDKRPTPASFADFLETDHRGLTSLELAPGSYRELFPERAEDASTWYLVDPAGWIMMSYNREIPYKDVISDLKFLLKNSSE